jgi:hypothetical protein
MFAEVIEHDHGVAADAAKHFTLEDWDDVKGYLGKNAVAGKLGENGSLHSRKRCRRSLRSNRNSESARCACRQAMAANTASAPTCSSPASRAGIAVRAGCAAICRRPSRRLPRRVGSRLECQSARGDPGSRSRVNLLLDFERAACATDAHFFIPRQRDKRRRRLPAYSISTWTFPLRSRTPPDSDVLPIARTPSSE